MKEKCIDCGSTKNLEEFPLVNPTKTLQEVGGVYIFYLEGEPIYVGQTISFNRREKSHISGYGDSSLKKKLEVSEKYSKKDISDVKIKVIPKKENRLELEKHLIEALDPPLNGVVKRYENDVKTINVKEIPDKVFKTLAKKKVELDKDWTKGVDMSKWIALRTELRKDGRITIPLEIRENEDFSEKDYIAVCIKKIERAKSSKKLKQLEQERHEIITTLYHAQQLSKEKKEELIEKLGTIEETIAEEGEQ